MTRTDTGQFAPFQLGFNDPNTSEHGVATGQRRADSLLVRTANTVSRNQLRIPTNTSVIQVGMLILDTAAQE